MKDCSKPQNLDYFGAVSRRILRTGPRNLWALDMTYTLLYHDLLSPPVSHYSFWSVISAHNLTPLKHED